MSKQYFFGGPSPYGALGQIDDSPPADAAVQRILRWDQLSPLDWRWAEHPG